MRCLLFPLLLVLMVFIAGCAEEEAGAPDKEPGYDPEVKEHEPVLKEDKSGKREDTGAIDIELGEYISEDKKVTVEIQDFRHDVHIAKDVGDFFSKDNDTNDEQVDNGKDNAGGVFFESSTIRLQDNDVYYLSLFMIINNIEEGFLKIPHGFNGEQPVLLTEDGTAHERIITQFKYTGSSGVHSGANDLPAGSEGVVVFAYPVDETPEEVHYIFSLEDSNSPGRDKGKIIIPIKSLTNN